MILAYLEKNLFKSVEINATNSNLLRQALWIDMLSPTSIEEDLVESLLDMTVPTREEMREIELSSRLYQKGNAQIMTATMLAQAESSEPQYDAVTFILTSSQLVTIRYIEPQSFKFFVKRLQGMTSKTAHQLFIELLDTAVERVADVLEMVIHKMEEISRKIFHTKHLLSSKRLDYKELMQQLGTNGDINTKSRESLLTFNRLISFFDQSASNKLDPESLTKLATVSRDILALSDHASFLSNKINFLLDATLGMVSIEQNNIIKIFSVAAVIFLPPTLIASIYGMNFAVMPELNWKWGYLIALVLMVVSAILPYLFFKSRRWL